MDLTYHGSGAIVNTSAYTSDKKASPDSGTRCNSKGVCKNVVHEDVCISAKVDIDPIVDIGPIRTHCLSREIIPCDGKCGDKCSFIVRQHICVEVPMMFGAATVADPIGMSCSGGEDGPCGCD